MASVTAQFDRMASDVVDAFGESVTLKYTAAGTTLAGLSASTGVRTETVTTQTISANRGPRTSRRAGAGEGHGIIHERMYWVRAASVTLNSGSVIPGQFRVVDGSDEYEVMGVEAEAAGAMLMLRCQKKG